MAAPTYGTDLNPVSLCEDTTGWAEMTGRTSGGAATQEDRAYIQGNFSVSQSTGAASGRTMGLQYDYGSNLTWTTGFVILMWQYWQAPKAIGTWADGGMRVAIGSSAGNMRLFNAQGNDYGRNPYGGWANTAIDPTYTPDENVGSPVNGAYRIFGSAPYLLSSVSKGNPHCVDAIRYGRGQIVITNGDSGSPGNFADMAAANDADAARWGLFSYQTGSYLWKGLMSLGTASVPVYFIGANKSVVIDDTPRTYADFNKIEIRHASSRVDWTAVTFMALGTLSKGRLEVVDLADVNISGCLFGFMDTFIFKSTCDVLLSTFLECGVITANGANFSGTKFNGFTGVADTSQLVWDTNVTTDGKLDGCTFTKGVNATHAIQLGTNGPTEITLRGCTFSGYNASHGQNDSTVLVSRTEGTVTINVVGCTGNVSYKTAGATVVLVLNPVTLTLTGIQVDSEVRIYEHGTTTELAGAEDVDTGTFSYQYTTMAGTYVDIVVHNVNFLYYRIENYLLSAGNATIPIQQQEDRQYDNP